MTDFRGDDMAGADYFHDLRAELLGPLRDEPLTAREMRLIAIMQRGGVDQFSVYGRDIAALARDQVTILGRTVLECMTDDECRQVVDLVLHHRRTEQVDQPWAAELFCGSGNLTFHLSQAGRHTCVATDTSPAVFEATSSNLKALGCTADVAHLDYGQLVQQCQPRSDDDLFVIDPPWGPAFTAAGLNLGTTSPPVGTAIDTIVAARGGRPFQVLVKGSDAVTNESRKALLDTGHLLDELTLNRGEVGLGTVYWLLRV